MDAAKLASEAKDDSRATVIGSVVFCITFPAVLVGARIYTRTRVIELFGVDDILAIGGILATAGCGIAIAAMTTHGLGRHISTLSTADITEYMHIFYVSIVLYNIALLLIKLSFLFQYYRIMAVPRMRRIYAVAMVIVGAWATAQVLVAGVQCMPVEGFWDKTVRAKCIPVQPQWYVNAAGNIASDVAVFALPLPIFWQLSLPRKQKLLLIGIFSLGFFTVAVSVVRTKYLKIEQDFTWTNVEASLWSLGELSSAVTCACLPTLRPLMTKLFPKMMARVNYSLQSHQTDTRATYPTSAYPASAYPPSAYPATLVKPDVEKAATTTTTTITYSAIASPSARSSQMKDDNGSVAPHGNPFPHQHETTSTESIFGLASVREDAITPARSNFSPASPRPTWSPSGKSSQGRRNFI